MTQMTCNDCGLECERRAPRQLRCKPCAAVRIASEARRRAREWHHANKGRAAATAATWRAANSDRAVARAAAWNQANPGRRKVIISESAKRCRQLDPERFKAKRAARRADPGVRLHEACSAAIRTSLRGCKGGQKWECLVGYTIADLRAHLERQFTRRMTWDNYGDWHVDHILPVSGFTFTSADDPDFRACWALTNLRPLWAPANMSKSNKRTLLL